MTWVMRIALAMAVCSTGVLTPLRAEPLAKPKTKVEFHWVSTEPIPGVTEEQGIPMPDRNQTFYLYKKAILTSEDVVKTRVSKITFNAAGPDPTDMFTIYFELSAAAKAKLAADCGEGGAGLLAPLVDGKYRGAAYFQTGSKDAFVPFSGLYTSQAEGDRIVEAVKKE